MTVPASWLGWVIGEKDEMVKLLARELKNHAPFTALGSVTGIAIMVVVVFGKVSYQISQGIFYTLHPLHVLLSALVTTAIFKRHSQGKLLPAIVIGYSGSIGIATISDSLIPYVGGVLLGVEMEFHIGFIEKWWFVNPLALAGITIGYLRPTNRSLPNATARALVDIPVVVERLGLAERDQLRPAREPHMPFDSKDCTI